MLEREHAVKVEALRVLILLHVCVHIPLYMCPHRNEVAVLETEHAVKVEALEALLLEVVLSVLSIGAVRTLLVVRVSHQARSRVRAS